MRMAQAVTSNVRVIFGTHDDRTLAQLQDVASRAEAAALMADGHLGYVMPIGGVAAYRGQVSPVGVGFDIACGNAAIMTDATLADFGRTERQRALRLGRLADDIASTISFGVGRTNKADDAPTDHPLFDSDDWFRIRERAGHGEMCRLRDRAQQQLGTVGSGNHYVDVFADERGRIWVGVHFGSRGFGHGIATGFLNESVTGDWFGRASEQEVLLDLRSSIGDDYWALMNLAGQYAYAGREWVARKVVALMGAKELDLVHNHHNFAWLEEHDGEQLVVVRKGATPAFPGQRGFIGGSMGDDAVIVQGSTANTDLQRAALYSTVHGAGRVMSRREAAGRRRRRTGEILSPGKISPDMMHDWLQDRGVILRGGGLDEAPQAYRRLPDVLAAQGDTIEVLHTLRPLIVVMAGDGVEDPYKD